MKERIPLCWAGIDVGKGHHWICLIDEAGTTVWSHVGVEHCWGRKRVELVVINMLLEFRSESARPRRVCGPPARVCAGEASS